MSLFFLPCFGFPRRYAALVLLVCALLISTLITNERITAFAEGQLYADSIIFSDVVDVHWHYYAPIGITMVYVLQQSSLTLHT